MTKRRVDRERQNMRKSSKREGKWCVVGFCNEWNPSVGLQGWNYESRQKAKKKADELDETEEYQHVKKHQVMTKDGFESLCQELGINRSFPWNN